MEHLLLILISLRELARFSRVLKNEKRKVVLMYFFGGALGTLLVGLGPWLPFGPLGWVICGIALLCGPHIPCSLGFVNTNRMVWFVRNLLHIVVGILCLAYGLGYGSSESLTAYW